jgi:hypothetical protein
MQNGYPHGMKTRGRATVARLFIPTHGQWTFGLSDESKIQAK